LGVKYTGYDKFAFSAEIAVYVRNGTKYAHSYYGSLIGIIAT